MDRDLITGELQPTLNSNAKGSIIVNNMHHTRHVPSMPLHIIVVKIRKTSRPR